MTADRQSQNPGWGVLYQQQAVESMPWFYHELDDDLRQALDRLGLHSGSVLDLGSAGRARRRCSLPGAALW